MVLRPPRAILLRPGLRRLTHGRSVRYGRLTARKVLTRSCRMRPFFVVFSCRRRASNATSLTLKWTACVSCHPRRTEHRRGMRVKSRYGQPDSRPAKHCSPPRGGGCGSADAKSMARASLPRTSRAASHVETSACIPNATSTVSTELSARSLRHHSAAVKTVECTVVREETPPSGTRDMVVACATVRANGWREDAAVVLSPADHNPTKTRRGQPTPKRAGGLCRTIRPPHTPGWSVIPPPAPVCGARRVVQTLQ